MIYLSWASFRRGFSYPRATSDVGVSLTFVPLAAPFKPFAQRTDGGSFITDGWTAAMRADISGTVSNNLSLELYDVTADTLTFDELNATVTGEVVLGGAHIDGRVYDKDGVPTWPYASKVRAAGFAALQVTPVTPSLSAPVVVHAAANCDWYVSQRSDDPTKQLWTPSLGDTAETLRLTATALASTEAPSSVGAPFILPGDMATLFRSVDVYARRQSDGSIQWVDLYRELV